MSEPLRICAKRLGEYLDHRVGCDATWKNGVRRKFPDQEECGCGLNDLLNQPLPSPETTPAGVLDEAALREALRVAVGLAEQNRDAILVQPYDSRYRDGYRSGIDAAAAIISGSVARALAAALGRSGSGGGRG